MTSWGLPAPFSILTAVSLLLNIAERSISSSLLSRMKWLFFIFAHLEKTHSPLDPFPSLLFPLLPTLSPLELFYSSLFCRIILVDFNSIYYILSAIKKPNLNPNDSDGHLLSLLPFFYKMLERLVVSRPSNHIDLSNLGVVTISISINSVTDCI